MVIRGNTRGNGKQLAQYLTAKRDNEYIEILEVDGRWGKAATSEHLSDVLVGMDLMSELTKSNKGLYHAQINPAYREDKNMDWFKAADMLGAELGLENQRRVIVLHEKKGRTHAHVVWERYDYETGKIKSDSFSRLAQDRARRSMELEFGHKQTPRRNQQRPQLKASLNQLWHQTGTGAQFLTACKNNNYMIAQGVGRTPFIVVDENGHSFNLVRQLTGIRLKDVRQRLRNETLMTEKQAIVYMRNLKDDRDSDGREKQKARLTPSTAKQLSQQFTANAHNHTQPDKTQSAKTQSTDTSNQFIENRSEVSNPQIQEKNITKEFAANKDDSTVSEREQIRQAWRKEKQANHEKKNERDRGMDYE